MGKALHRYEHRTEKRGKKDFERDFFNLINNSDVGKFKENIRKHKDINICGK